MSRRNERVIRLSARSELVLVIVLGAVVMLVVALGAAFATRSVAQGQALEDAERSTRGIAESVVRPLWSGYPPRDPARAAELRRDLEHRMSDRSLSGVTIWSADGTVLFSDRETNIGKKLPVSTEVLAAIRGDTISQFEDDAPEADASSPDEAELSQAHDTGPKRFVEVYAPLRVDGYPPLAFEAYYDYQPVDELAGRLLRQALPLVLIPLLVLQLVQIPIAISLARRIKRHENDRSRLLARALTVSDRERVRFAADLHDGPIQDLAGISYALGAVASSIPQQQAPLMARVLAALERAIASLRGLMTDLYPPDLGSGNLGHAIAALAEPLREQGIDVQLSLAEVPTISEEGAATLYRVARESVANAKKHSQASTVSITLTAVENLRPTEEPRVRLLVADDGVGVDPAKLDRRSEGHFGLRLLSDRVASFGGELTITSAVGQGTTVQAELPVGAASDGREPGPTTSP